jgi:hypothetical protein
MRNLPGSLEVSTHEHEPMPFADWSIEGSGRSPLFAGELCCLAQERPASGERLLGMLDLAQASSEGSDGSAHAVAEKLRSSGQRSRLPCRALWREGLRRGVEQDPEQHQRGEAISENVVKANQHRDAAVKPFGEEPDFPQGMRSVERPVVQLHAGRQECILAPRGRNRARPYVPAVVEARVIDPYRCAEAEPGPVEALPKPRRQVEAFLDPRSDRFNVKLPRRVEQRPRLEDGERANVHRQPMLLDAQVADIERGHSLQQGTASAPGPAVGMLRSFSRKFSEV